MIGHKFKHTNKQNQATLHLERCNLRNMLRNTMLPKAGPTFEM